MKKRASAWSFAPIGIVQSAFKEKFGIPRQPGLVKSARATLKLADDPDLVRAIEGLGSFSHLWVVFVFHEHDAKNWKPSVRPPRLGGRERVGVLASRSPHRPNPIGLSAVKIESVTAHAPGGAEIEVSGVDILDGSPILDIKPYIPYADAVSDASAGWAEEPIRRIEVVFAPKARDKAARIELKSPGFEALVREMLSIDPRPAFQKRKMPPGSSEAEGKRFGIRIDDWDVKWRIRSSRFEVIDIVSVRLQGRE